ncbi:hypothetical protein ABLO16_20075, partial [Mycobacterium tuberculosis]
LRSGYQDVRCLTSIKKGKQRCFRIYRETLSRFSCAASHFESAHFLQALLVAVVAALAAGMYPLGVWDG